MYTYVCIYIIGILIYLGIECLYRNKQNLIMIVSGEGTGLGKKSTLYPLSLGTIISIRYIFNALA